MLVLPTILLLLGVITCGLGYLHWYQTRSHFARLLNQFPEYWKGLPFIGHVYKLSTNPVILYRQIRENLAGVTESKMGWSGNIGCLHVVTADDTEIILSSTKHISKGVFYTFFESWLGTGLLTSSGNKWHTRRKILTTAFHFNILRRFVDIFGDHSANLVRKLKDEMHKNNIINVVPILSQITLASICESAMGTKINSENKTQGEYLDAIHKAGKCLILRGFSPLLYADFIYNLTPFGWKYNKYIKALHKFTNDIIIERERTYKDSDVEDGTKRLAMLDLLISAKRNRNEIDHAGICEEVDTFVFEAHDTTSRAITFGLMELAKHHDIQQNIIEELDEIFKKDTRPAKHEDLLNMKYLELCIKECLRLYPSVPLLIRSLSEDTQLTHHVAPAGTIILLHVYNVHRDPKQFPDPEKFDPNRFLAENCNGRNPYAYIPFSAGPRNCIGQKYAMLQLKSIFSSVFRNFTLESVSTEHNVEWIADMTLRVEGPVNVKFVPRN